jgi:hypothetical protein
VTSLLPSRSATVRYAGIQTGRRNVVAQVLERHVRVAARFGRSIAQRVRPDRLGRLRVARKDALAWPRFLASSLAPSCELALEGPPH